MSPRNSIPNNVAIISALVFAVATGVTGHLWLSIAVSLLGAVLCIAIINRDPM